MFRLTGDMANNLKRYGWYTTPKYYYDVPGHRKGQLVYTVERCERSKMCTGEETWETVAEIHVATGNVAEWYAVIEDGMVIRIINAWSNRVLGFYPGKACITFPCTIEEFHDTLNNDDWRVYRV